MFSIDKGDISQACISKKATKFYAVKAYVQKGTPKV